MPIICTLLHFFKKKSKFRTVRRFFSVCWKAGYSFTRASGQKPEKQQPWWYQTEVRDR